MEDPITRGRAGRRLRSILFILLIALVVGAGAILSLVLRVFGPVLFDRKPKDLRVGEPMTIQLKPRAERHLKRT